MILAFVSVMRSKLAGPVKLLFLLLLPYVPALPSLVPDVPMIPLKIPRLSNPQCARSSVVMPVASSGRRASPLFTRKAIRERASGWTIDRMEVPRWRLYRTDRFVIRSNALLDDLRLLGVYLEEFLGILKREIGGDSTGIRFSMHLFRHEDPFRRYARSRGVMEGGGFYDQERSEVVAYLPGKEGWSSFYGILIHELTHHYLDRVFEEEVPPWLNEGLAEYFGALRIDRKGIYVGREIPSYRVILAAFLGHPDWVSLTRISQMSASEYFSEAPLLVHAEAWSFVRFLFRTDREGLHRLLAGGPVGNGENEWMESLRKGVP